MPRDLDATLEYDRPATTVMVMLTDPAYGSSVVRGTGGTDEEVTLEGDATGPLTLRLARTLPTESVPSYAKSFLGNGLRITETRVWDAPDSAGSREGTFTVEFNGVPLVVSGTLHLHADEGATTVTIRAQAKASVPFVGGKIEQFAVEQMQRFVAKEQKIGDEYLAGP